MHGSRTFPTRKWFQKRKHSGSIMASNISEDVEGISITTRQRSNSDPESAAHVLKDLNLNEAKKTNGQLRTGSLGPPGCRTPPVERKSKFSTLGKLFKPWKWKRKKKSEKFEQTSITLERKISVRATREELISRGVLILDPPIQETESVKDKPEKSVNGTVFTTDHSIPSNTFVSINPENRPPSFQGPVSLPEFSISSEARPILITTDSASVTTIQVEPPDTIVIEKSSGSSYNISPVASGILISGHMEVESNNHHYSREPPEMDEPDYDNPNEINFNEGPPDEMFCSVFFDIVQIGLPIPDYDDNEEPEIHIPIIRLPQPNPEIDTTKFEEIPAKDPDLQARPRKSALKKKGEPLTPTSNHPPDISSLRIKDGSSSPRFSPQFSVPNMINNIENKENRPRLPPHIRKPSDVNAKDDLPVKYRDDEDEKEEKSRIAAKIARKNSLALKLSQRPDIQELIDRNIIPSQSETERQETMEAIGNRLSRRLSLRPTQQELEQRNILKQQTADEEKKEKEEKKIMLLRKLSFRPTIEELKERKIIRFNDYVEVTQVEDYDRKADKPWTRLTPRDKAAIRKELNEFKSTEMEVHEESRQFTRFHRP